MIKTKYPEIQETIFTTISKLAKEHSAINLGQGFPDYDGHPYLLERLAEHAKGPKNQYAPMSGVQELREQVKNLHAKKIDLDINDNIVVTSGATEALASTLMALVDTGDEVIVLDPAFDCYHSQIRFAGGTPVHVNLNPDDFKIDFKALKEKLNSKTKAIILNFPHNPCGSVLDQKDLDQLHNLIKDTNILLISDEVYQYMVFDGDEYYSPLYDKRLSERTIKIVSFGKMFHVTGWKLGYCIGPKTLIDEVKKVHQFNTFCSFGPAQFALADMLAKFPNHPFELAKFYQEKRDYFLNQIKDSKFQFSPSKGSYFQILDYGAISRDLDTDYCVSLIKESNLASIPLTVFYDQTPQDQTYLRFCFAKSKETLDAAAKVLNSL